MTKKDFEFIARTIRIMAESDKETAAKTAVVFQSALASQNDRFDGSRFRKACGV